MGVGVTSLWGGFNEMLTPVLWVVNSLGLKIGLRADSISLLTVGVMWGKI